MKAKYYSELGQPFDTAEEAFRHDEENIPKLIKSYQELLDKLEAKEHTPSQVKTTIMEMREKVLEIIQMYQYMLDEAHKSREACDESKKGGSIFERFEINPKDVYKERSCE